VLPALAGVVFSLAVAVRRRWPLGGILFVLAAWTLGVVLGSRGGLHGAPAVVPITLLFYGLGAFASERRSVSVLGLAVVVIAIDALIAGGRQAWNLPGTEVFGLLVPYAVGRMVRERAARELAYREQSERLDAARDVSARKAAYEERARIARELHDVIAHSVSVMVIQAGGARPVMGSDQSVPRARSAVSSALGGTLWRRCAGCSVSLKVTRTLGRWRRSRGSRTFRICCRPPAPRAWRPISKSLARR
jgi:signal transduction histidine kinase